MGTTFLGIRPQDTSSSSHLNPQIFIVQDNLNTEAVATAHILRDLLLVHSLNNLVKIPHLLHLEQALPTTATDIVVLCSAGVFTREDILAAFYTAAENSMSSVPILNDDAFRFPTPAFLESVRPFVANLKSERGG